MLLGLSALSPLSDGYGVLAAFSGCALAAIGIFALTVALATYRITSRSHPLPPALWDISAKVRRLSIVFLLVACILVFSAQFFPPKSCGFCFEGGTPPGVKMGLAFYGVGRLTLVAVFIRLSLLRLCCPMSKSSEGGGQSTATAEQQPPSRSLAAELPYLSAAVGSALFVAQMSPSLTVEFYCLGWLMIPAVCWAVLRVNKDYEGTATATTPRNIRGKEEMVRRRDKSENVKAKGGGGGMV
jgi:hypothetical protein